MGEGRNNKKMENVGNVVDLVWQISSEVEKVMGFEIFNVSTKGIKNEI